MKQLNRNRDADHGRSVRVKHRNDLILAVVIFVVAAAGFFLYKGLQHKGTCVVVIQSGNEVCRLSLNEEKEYRIEGEDGNYNVLCIKDEKAYMHSADCPDQICVNHRPIQNVGETIVCLPNEVVIKVISDETESKTDLII